MENSKYVLRGFFLVLFEESDREWAFSLSLSFKLR